MAKNLVVMYSCSADLSILTPTRFDGYMIFMVCFSALLVLLFIVLPIFLLCFYPCIIYVSMRGELQNQLGTVILLEDTL